MCALGLSRGSLVLSRKSKEVGIQGGFLDPFLGTSLLVFLKPLGGTNTGPTVTPKRGGTTNCYVSWPQNWASKFKLGLLDCWTAELLLWPARLAASLDCWTAELLLWAARLAASLDCWTAELLLR